MQVFALLLFVLGAVREWLSVDELAAELGIPPKTVHSWRGRGIAPPAHKIGRHLRFRRRDFEKWLSERRDDPRPAA